MPITEVSNRWGVLALLMLARICMGLQFISASALIPFIVEDLSISYTQAGTLIGLLLLPGAFISIPSGLLVGWLGDKHALGAALLFLLLGSLLMAFSSTFALAVVARICGGVGAVLVMVMGPKITTDRFADGGLATAMGILIPGWPVGVALGLAALAAIASVSSWQSAMHAISTLTGLSLVLWYLFYRELPVQIVEDSESRPHLWTISKRELVLILAVSMIWLFINTGFIVFVSFVPLLLIERGFTEIEAGFMGSLGAWLAIVSVPLGGYLIDRSRRSSLIIASGGVSGGLIIVFMLLGGPALLWVVAWGLLRALGAGGVMALAGGALSPQGRATGFGVFFTIYYGGMFAVPPLAGYLLDQFGTAQASLLLAVALQLMVPLSLGIFLILRKRMDSPTPHATP